MSPDVHLASVLSDKVLYSWGGDNEDVGRKVIVISSCVLEKLDSITKTTLMVSKFNNLFFVSFTYWTSDVNGFKLLTVNDE